ncbi:MAG: helix-turn-helix transcriptional regulator [Prevotellaceae bacterium]|nr:helix-turn-helix transcriptional regulator [Prevotellaceae bacterium]
MVKTKLIEARRNRGYSQEYMANFLNMDVSNYNRRENGQIKISTEHWQIIAKELKVPLENIYEAEENLIFIFNDNSTGNGNIVNNYSLPQEVLDSFKNRVYALEE